MRAKSLALLVLALGCGLVAAIGITQVMAKKTSGPAMPVGETVDVYVALEEIPFGEAITPQNVKLEAWPKSKVPADAITKMADLEERRTKVALFPGEPILDKKLFKPGDTAQGAVVFIPKGYRVVAVKVDSVTGGANLIRPGNRVDVLVNLRKNPEAGIKVSCTKVLLQDVKVFAVNDVVRLERTKGADETITAATISLLVTPEQGAKVALATQLGTIQLSLRSYDDEDMADVEDIDVRDIFGPSEEGDREAESFVPEVKSSEKEDLLSFLDQMQAGTTPEPDPADTAAPLPAGPESETWQMRVITGDAVDLKQLERSAAEAAARGGRMWRVSSVDPDAASRAAASPATTGDSAETDASADVAEPDGSGFPEGLNEEDSIEK